jgi:tRNA (guanine37-N1)-methyltransferase
MLFSILTIFPSLLDSPLAEGIIHKAIKERLISLEISNIRDFARDKHATTDDRPFGGGEGMVMKPEPLARAVKHACQAEEIKRRVVLLSPQGRLFDQRVAEELSKQQHLVLVCGRYEGVDERFRQHYVDDEISIGDFILTGGELGALVILDAVTRLIPGVLGCTASAENDTFSRNLLKHPQYTRPRVFEEKSVPAELLSGDHQKIRQFRLVESVKRTRKRRPDLLDRECFSADEMKLLRKHGLGDGLIVSGKDKIS